MVQPVCGALLLALSVLVKGWAAVSAGLVHANAFTWAAVAWQAWANSSVLVTQPGAGCWAVTRRLLIAPHQLAGAAVWHGGSALWLGGGVACVEVDRGGLWSCAG